MRSKATQRRRLAVLAYLALSPNRSATREAIMGLLWAELSPENAKRNMAEAVYQIRKELDQDVLRSDGEDLTLSPAVRCDVDAFEQAMKAGDLPAVVDVYQGPLFGTWSVGDAPEYEQWAENVRAALRRRFQQVLQKGAEDSLAAGQFEAAYRWYERLAIDDPDLVAAVEGKARALAGQGEPRQAVRVLDEYAARLERNDDGPVPAVLKALRQELLNRASEMPASVRPIPDKPRAAEPLSTTPSSTTTPVVSAPGATPGATPAAAPGSPMGSAKRRWGWAGLAAVLVLLLGATQLLRDRPIRPVVAVDEMPATRVAIVPAAMPSSDSSLSFLSDALLSAVTDQLTTNALPVATRGEVRAVEAGRGSIDSLVALRRIGTLVELGLTRLGTEVRMTVRLIDAQSHAELASRVFAKSVDQALLLETDVSRYVAEALGRRMNQVVVLRDTLQFTRDAYARKLLVAAVRAREDVERLRGQVRSVDRDAALQSLRSADSLLLRAQQQEPDWTALQVERARLRLELSRMIESERSLAILDSGILLATQALALNPDDPSALTIRGQLQFFAGNHESRPSSDTVLFRRATEDLLRATTLAPYRADAWMSLHTLYNVRGQYDMAHAAVRRAFENDAFMYDSERAYFVLFAAAIGTGDLSDAYRWCSQGRLAYPENTMFVHCELTLMRERPHRADDVARARQLIPLLDSMFENTRNGAKDPYMPLYTRMVAAGVLARSGDKAGARQELEATRRMLPTGLRKPRQSFAFDEGWVHLQLGDTARAIAVLSALVREDRAMHERVLSVPMYRSLRSALPPLGAAARTAPATSAPPATR
ncbi:MAG: hypothetical protein IBJ19_05470 [Gemmatimonadaceae bacterium]|nr:hypothetical protein [Gemmatimonadaceae bacterium]